MKKIVFVGFIVLAALMSCGNKRLSPEVLQHKLDSVRVLEAKEKLRAQGVDLDKETNPLKQFFDSLNVQPLPISYSENYVKYVPNFVPVPGDIVSYLNLEGKVQPKAISLPESFGARLMLLAADESENLYSLWLYSLDDDYFPVDKLCLYAAENNKLSLKNDVIQFFSITSDYEIHLMDYTKTGLNEEEEIYHIDASRKIVELETEEQ